MSILHLPYSRDLRPGSFYEQDFPAVPPLPEFSFDVANIEPLKVELNPAQNVARIVTSLVVMTDGSQNILRQIKSSNRQYERRLRYALPLGTRVNGFNTCDGIMAAQQGMDVDMIGTSQVIGDDPYLAHETYAFAKTMEVIDEEENGFKESIIGGKSQGAMKAPGNMAYMNQLGYSTPIAIVQDPCLAEKTGLIETATTMTPSYFKNEILEGGKALLEREEGESYLQIGKRLLGLASTVSPSPQYLKTHARVTWELWKGEAGDLAANLPPEAMMVVHFFNKSRMNQSASFRERTRHLPYAHAVDQDGWHLTMMRKSVNSRYIQQIVTAQKMLDEGYSQPEIIRALDYPIVEPKDKPKSHLRSVT